MITDREIERLAREAYAGKPRMSDTIRLCAELKDARAKVAKTEQRERSAYAAIAAVASLPRNEAFRAKARAWFGRRIVLSLAP